MNRSAAAQLGDALFLLPAAGFWDLASRLSLADLPDPDLLAACRVVRLALVAGYHGRADSQHRAIALLARIGPRLRELNVHRADPRIL
jgi:hypothetical protein